MFRNRYQRAVEKLLHSGTRGRYYYELGLTGIRVILNEGWRGFFKKVKIWFRLRKTTARRGRLFRKPEDILIIPKPQRVRLALIHATRDLPGYNVAKPLGLGYLKSYLRMKLSELGVDIYEDVNSLMQSKPDCVGVSASTQDFAVAQRYIKQVQEELGCPVLLGGVHISLLPETLPKGAIACIGEGEETLTELMDLFLQRHVFGQEELSKIKGIAYWDQNDNLVQTEPRELIVPLDRLPLPDRDAIGVEPKGDMIVMFSSRGCPYTCKFCVSRVHWAKYREFSAGYVLNEIEEMVSRYGVKNIVFYDDLFIVNRKRLRDIIDGLAKRRCSISISCQIRANLVDDELCELLNKLNCKEVSFGAESFSEPVLRELKSESVTVAQNQHALDTLHKHGIKTNVSMIFDAPVETREDLLTSWRALFDNLRLRKINKVGWGLLIPYPGSGYWDLAVQKGTFRIDMDWEIFRDWGPFHFNDNMTKAEVDAIIDEWETKCYLVNLHFRHEPQPRYISKVAIFAAKEDLIKRICQREPKDETDTFVMGEYQQFLESVASNRLVLNQGWEPSSGQSYRWIKRRADFFIHSSTKNKANLLNLVFFVQNIDYYPEKKISVTLKIGNTQNSIAVLTSGQYTISAPLPCISLKDFIHCMIICDADFCPARVTDSLDNRNLSIVVSRLELAKGEPSNIVSVVRLPQD